jgi:hypothetical protein
MLAHLLLVFFVLSPQGEELEQRVQFPMPDMRTCLLYAAHPHPIFATGAIRGGATCVDRPAELEQPT